MELRALTVLDSLQPQLTGFLQMVCSGFIRAVTESLKKTMRAIGRMPCARMESTTAFRFETFAALE